MSEQLNLDEIRVRLAAATAAWDSVSAKYEKDPSEWEAWYSSGGWADEFADKMLREDAPALLSEALRLTEECAVKDARINRLSEDIEVVRQDAANKINRAIGGSVAKYWADKWAAESVENDSLRAEVLRLTARVGVLETEVAANAEAVEGWALIQELLPQVDWPGAVVWGDLKVEWYSIRYKTHATAIEALREIKRNIEWAAKDAQE